MFVVYRCLEGGAEEFLLKPLQLSDMEKLQPHLLKSLDQSCEGMDNSGSTATATAKNSSSNNISKRKAISPEPPSERRPKMKGLAVV